MSAELPTELLELIVGCLGNDEASIRDLISLCLTARRFVGCCQKRIFQTVTLYHPISESYRDDPLVWAKKYSTAIHFAQAVVQRPGLGLHVKRLIYWMPLDDMRETDKATSVIMQALSGLEGISELVLAGFDNCLAKPPFLAMRSKAWQSVATTLIQRPSMTRLILCGIFQFPLHLLLKAERLDHLGIYHTHLGGESPLPATPLRLKVLRYGGPSPLFTPTDRHSASLLGISNLLELDVHVGASGKFNEESIRILGMCRTLCKLTITYVENTAGTLTQSPLNALNPDSFRTLTTLTINIIIGISQPNTAIAHPYGSFPFNTVLRRLGKLETLVLNVFFQGHVAVHPCTFGPYSTWEWLAAVANATPPNTRGIRLPKWTGIYGPLCDRSVLPALKEFGINVQVRSEPPSDGSRSPSSSANAFAATLMRLVRPAMVERSKAIGIRNTPMQLGFSTSVSVGPPLGLVSRPLFQ